eukprot:1103670-Prymnesium_polylepis.1
MRFRGVCAATPAILLRAHLVVRSPRDAVRVTTKPFELPEPIKIIRVVLCLDAGCRLRLLGLRHLRQPPVQLNRLHATNLSPARVGPEVLSIPDDLPLPHSIDDRLHVGVCGTVQEAVAAAVAAAIACPRVIIVVGFLPGRMVALGVQIAPREEVV